MCVPHLQYDPPSPRPASVSGPRRQLHLSGSLFERIPPPLGSKFETYLLELGPIGGELAPANHEPDRPAHRCSLPLAGPTGRGEIGGAAQSTARALIARAGRASNQCVRVDAREQSSRRLRRREDFASAAGWRAN